MGKAERTKEFIIEKTAPVFNTKGFAGTSMHDITEETGLTKGSIYGNFKNKDDVAIAVFKYNINELRRVFASHLAEKTGYKDKLLVYPELYKNYFEASFPAGGCPIMNTAIEADDTHPELKRLAKKALLDWKESLSDTIRKGVENKEFKAETNIEETALTILALIEGAVMMAKLTDDSKPLSVLMDTLKKLINQL
mgnify:CR=1 FL=1